MASKNLYKENIYYTEEVISQFNSTKLKVFLYMLFRCERH
jgi:hypothetical protein